MDWKTFLVAFGTIFLAEIGDKTQLAVIGLTGRTGSPLSVFSGAVASLAIITIVGVLIGEGLFRVIPKEYIKIGAGLLFIGVGILILGGRL
jgi:putative Ca2+/H+ antiporter (TMEM165/GDT1 family)